MRRFEENFGKWVQKNFMYLCDKTFCLTAFGKLLLKGEIKK